MLTSTLTRSNTDSFTESRARYVLGKIFDDFNGIIFRGFTSVSSTDLKNWRDDIQYVMERNALRYFEFQFSSSGRSWYVRYEVDKSGRLSRDDESGGIDFYNIPASATFNIVMRRDPDNAEVSEYLSRRKWGTGGNFGCEGGNNDRNYSKEGFGVSRKTLGDF